MIDVHVYGDKYLLLNKSLYKIIINSNKITDSTEYNQISVICSSLEQYNILYNNLTNINVKRICTTIEDTNDTIMDSYFDGTENTPILNISKSINTEYNTMEIHINWVGDV